MTDILMPMWDYWKSRKGGAYRAITLQYAEIAAADPIIRQAVETIRMAEAAIDKRMEEIEQEGAAR